MLDNVHLVKQTLRTLSLLLTKRLGKRLELVEVWHFCYDSLWKCWVGFYTN